MNDTEKEIERLRKCYQIYTDILNKHISDTRNEVEEIKKKIASQYRFLVAESVLLGAFELITILTFIKLGVNR